MRTKKVNKKPIGKRTKRLHESREDKALRIEMMLPQPKEFAIKSTKKVEKKVYSSKEIKGAITAHLKVATERKIEKAIAMAEFNQKKAVKKAEKLAKKAA